MKRYKKLIILLVLVLSISQVFSQAADKIKRGKVTDDKGLPLAEVIVVGDEGDVFTKTDLKGQFEIEVIFSDVLLLEKEGYNSQQVFTKDLSTTKPISLTRPEYLMGEKDLLQMPFRKLQQKRTTGSVVQVDVKELMKFDARQGLDAALNGKVSGLYGTSNIWGRGQAIVVVDGVPRSNNYEFYLREVETVTVLKDALTRSLYGAQADQGVIMVQTKRGRAYKREMDVQLELGVLNPVSNSQPMYMNAGDYMETYNTIAPNTYSAEKIQDTRNGVNPFLNPDNDFYSKQFLKSQSNYLNLFADASGGNNQGQYYVNLGWQHSNGWMNLGEQDTRDKVNFRGNIDYKLAESFKMRLDAGALFTVLQSPNVPDYWSQASKILPNSYPLSWDPNLITDPIQRTQILRSAQLVDGMLLGGNKSFSRNLYGDFKKGGNREILQRNLQVNLGAEWDLKIILPGLKATGNFSADTYNTVVKAQNSKYAVYNPTFFPIGSTNIIAEKVGEDVLASNYSELTDEMTFQRRLGMFANLTYDKKFGKTDVSLMTVAYGDRMAVNKAKQDIVNQTFGFNGNIMHDNRFLVDFSYAVLGSQKLAKEDRYGLSTSIGLGWILSEEKFMKDTKVFDFLKLRTTYGILNTDPWAEYFLYTTSFSTTGKFDYGNNIASNQELSFVDRANPVFWQKRKEFAIGFDAAMFKKTLFVAASYFTTESYDQVTDMVNLYPTLIGTSGTKVYTNYNADRINGYDLGLRYETVFSKKSALTFGTTFIATTREQTKKDEPVYNYAYQYAVGADTRAMRGLASNGLYSPADFDALGNLLPSFATPTWGKVAPGDIKYIDWNGDKIVNSDDVHIIGQSAPNYQYSFYLNLKIHQLELYALGVGQNGAYGSRSGDYFRAYGTLKFPEHLKEAYSATNPNVNAIYPRLTNAQSQNNNQSSDYWIYKNNWFSMPTMQLTYNFESKPGKTLKLTKVYLRGTDLFRQEPNMKYSDVRVGGEPRTTTVALGSIFKF
jgi:TonB-linked SusC/RagA family outer membrane protein